MGVRLNIFCVFCFAALCLAAGGCDPDPISTRAVEERYFGMGYAQQTYRYAEDLLKQGKYVEAHAAYNAAEKAAYTQSLRQAARQRRMWLEQVIAAREKGEQPPAEPINRGDADRQAPVPLLPPGAPPDPATDQSNVLTPPLPVVEKPLN